jgi:hypothetical protein
MTDMSLEERVSKIEERVLRMEGQMNVMISLSIGTFIMVLGIILHMVI